MRSKYTIQELELLVSSRQKPYLSFEEGALLYEMDVETFKEIAKEAHSIRTINRKSIVNAFQVNEYIRSLYE